MSTENNCFFHEIHARFKLNFCVERKVFKTGASLRYIYYIHTFYLRKNCYNKTNDKIDILFLVMLRIVPENSAQKCLFSSKSQVEQGFSLFFVKKWRFFFVRTPFFYSCRSEIRSITNTHFKKIIFPPLL